MLSAYSKNNERSERVGREHIESGQYFCAAASRASLNRLMFRPVNPMRKILRHVNFTNCEVQKVDLSNRTVTILHGFDRHKHALEFEHLVLAVGSVTNFHKIPGLEERAVTMKSLGDAIDLL
jgi:NADH dehydrogenase FAD-containing subunit